MHLIKNTLGTSGGPEVDLKIFFRFLNKRLGLAQNLLLGCLTSLWTSPLIYRSLPLPFDEDSPLWGKYKVTVKYDTAKTKKQD